MVLVNACCRTPTAFSQGEAPWAKAGAAKSSPKATEYLSESQSLAQKSSHFWVSPLCVASQIDLSWRVLAGIVAARRHLDAAGRTEFLL
jgi:hypothetical protein